MLLSYSARGQEFFQVLEGFVVFAFDDSHEVFLCQFGLSCPGRRIESSRIPPACVHPGSRESCNGGPSPGETGCENGRSASLISSSHCGPFMKTASPPFASDPQILSSDLGNSLHSAGNDAFTGISEEGSIPCPTDGVLFSPISRSTSSRNSTRFRLLSARIISIPRIGDFKRYPGHSGTCSQIQQRRGQIHDLSRQDGIDI